MGVKSIDTQMNYIMETEQENLYFEILKTSNKAEK